MSLRTRVALLVAAVVGLAVSIVSIVAYVMVRSELYANRDDNLLFRARAAVGSTLFTPEGLPAVPVEALQAGGLNLGLARFDGATLLAKGQRTDPPIGVDELAVARGLRPESIRTVAVNTVEYRVVAVPAGGGYALVLAEPTTQTERLLDRLGLLLLLIGAVGVAVAATAGLAIARAGLRPVARLTEAAERVASTDRLEPIEVAGDDELARLAVSFNAMLASLARSRERQQQLVADAGHELRTPLTSLRTNLDLLAQDDASRGRRLSPPERADLLADVRAQVEELSGLVQDLVELARDDPPGAQVEPLDFAEICERAIDRVRRRKAELTLEVGLEPWPIHGDATALERAVTNVLDNAAKWSPPGGMVSVRLAEGELRVSDTGPGISDADLPHVFDRFYRAPAARRLPGSGLGLAIVRQVVDRHGGSVSAHRADGGGTLIVLRIPAAPLPAGSSQVLARFSGSSQDARTP